MKKYLVILASILLFTITSCGSSGVIIAEQVRQVTIKLENPSDELIELVIPGYSNPAIYPNESETVKLKEGKEILFRISGKNYTLLKVDERTEDNLVVDVAQLLKERKAAINF